MAVLFFQLANYYTNAEEGVKKVRVPLSPETVKSIKKR